MAPSRVDRVLFVDDEPRVTAALQRMLRDEGYETRTATSAAEGLDLLEAERIDVVVSDEQMPGMLGTEFLALVARRHPDVVRVILTGHASIDGAVRAINESRVHRFLLKPCNEAELKVTIRQALQTRALVHGSRRLLDQCARQSDVLEHLEREHPGITRLYTDSSGAFVFDCEAADVEGVLRDVSRFLDRRAAQSDTPPTGGNGR